MYRILCIAVVLFFVSESILAGQEDIDERLIEECKKESNMSEEHLQSLISDGFPLDMTDPIGHCFVACCLTQRGVFNPDGSVNLELIDEKRENFENRDEMLAEYKECAAPPIEGCKKKFEVAVCLRRVTEYYRNNKQKP